MARAKKMEQQLTEYAAVLVKLIDRAITIIQEERDVAQSSYQDVNGEVPDIDQRREIARFDKWLKEARAELGKEAKHG
jgi:hypothetical protein